MVKIVHMGRPKAKLEVSNQQRKQLVAIVRRSSSAQSHVMRAQIVLECAKGFDNEEVAEQLGTTGQTVGKWRRRFIADGLQGLFDAPRLGAPRSVTDEVVAAAIRKTLDDTPKNIMLYPTAVRVREVGLDTEFDYRPLMSCFAAVLSSLKRLGV